MKSLVPTVPGLPKVITELVLAPGRVTAPAPTTPGAKRVTVLPSVPFTPPGEPVSSAVVPLASSSAQSCTGPKQGPSISQSLSARL